jgi:hypothetical protein
MYKQEFINRGKIIDDYQKALKWLESLGLDYRPTRFGRYYNDIKEYDNTSIDKNNRNTRKSKNNSYDTSFEAHQLITIYKGLHNYKDSKLFNDKLRIYLGGPIHSTDEQIGKGASSFARDIGLELQVASFFALGGFNVSVEHQSDVIAYDDDNYFHIECKRPSKEKTINKNLKRAYEQLDCRYRGYTGSKADRGLVVFGVDKIINPENKTLLVENTSQSIEVIDESVNNFLTSRRDTWKRNIHDKTTAIVAFFSMCAFIKDHDSTLLINVFNNIYVRRGHLADIKYLDLDRLYLREVTNRLNDGARKAFETN